MGFDKFDIIAVAVIILAVGSGGYLYFHEEEPEATGVLSIDKVNVADTKDVGWNKWENGWYHKEVEGKWIAHVTINQPEKYTFLQREKLEKDAPDSDTKYKTKSTMSLTLQPDGNPFYVSKATYHGYSINPIRDIGPPTWNRVFPWYEAEHWDALMVPWEAIVEKDGVEIARTTALTGPGNRGGLKVTNDFSLDTGFGEEVRFRGVDIPTTGGQAPPDGLQLWWYQENGYVEKRVTSQLNYDLVDWIDKDYTAPLTGEPKLWDKWCGTGNGSNKGMDPVPNNSEYWERTFEGRYGFVNTSNYIGGSETLTRTEKPLKLHRKYLPHDDGTDSDRDGVDIDAWLGTDDKFGALGDGKHASESDTGTYWIMETKNPKTTYSEVTIEASAETFDTIVWHPPSGKPKILNVFDVKMGTNTTKTVDATVKNVGKTPATINAIVEDLPSSVDVESTDSATLDPDEETTMHVSISSSGSEHLQKEATFKATANESRKEDSKSFNLTIDPDYNGNGGNATVTGSVIDKKTGQPIQGAVVVTGSIRDTTDISGEYELGGVPTGERDIKAMASGYEIEKITIRVKERENPAPVIEMKTRTGGNFPWLVIGIVAAVVCVAGGVIYYFRDEIFRR